MVSEFVDGMKWFRMKIPDIQAVQIDAAWAQFLIKERGYEKAPIGDYFVLGNDGPQVMPKKQFERLFEELPDGV